MSGPHEGKDSLSSWPRRRNQSRAQLPDNLDETTNHNLTTFSVLPGLSAETLYFLIIGEKKNLSSSRSPNVSVRKAGSSVCPWTWIGLKTRGPGVWPRLRGQEGSCSIPPSPEPPSLPHVKPPSQPSPTSLEFTFQQGLRAHHDRSSLTFLTLAISRPQAPMGLLDGERNPSHVRDGIKAMPQTPFRPLVPTVHPSPLPSP